MTATTPVTRLYHALDQDEHDMTWRQVATLASVAEQPGCSVRELSAALRVARPVVTRALDALSERGFAKRAKDPQDGRLIKVTATPEGTAFLAKVEKALAA